MKSVAILSLLVASAYCVSFPAIPKRDLAWWEKGAIYEIFLRSFKDSDGNGVGDLRGIIEKIDFLEYLGVEAVWLTSFYRSPMVDAGYDISDHKAIDPIYGTMQDFDMLVKALHKKDIKLIIDFVPNHTSDQHEWFLKSAKEDPLYSDYYVWADAKMVNGTRTLPNNWVSEFGTGTAWTWNEKRKQFYYHTYHTKEPDLNYRNPKLFQEMKEILTFWMDRGVDGFRMQGAFMLMEDGQRRDEPCCKAKIVGQEIVAPVYEKELKHVYTRHQPETFDILRQFRKHIDAHSQKSGKPK